jgi:hypothetical protein
MLQSPEKIVVTLHYLVCLGPNPKALATIKSSLGSCQEILCNYAWAIKIFSVERYYSCGYLLCRTWNLLGQSEKTRVLMSLPNVGSVK